MKVIKELFDCRCTIMDLALICVMKSLDGKSRTMQHQIANDINNSDITDQTNVFDMVQKYASSMASVGDGMPKQVHFGTINQSKKPEFRSAIPKRGGKRSKPPRKTGGSGPDKSAVKKPLMLHRGRPSTALPPPHAWRCGPTAYRPR